MTPLAAEPQRNRSAGLRPAAGGAGTCVFEPAARSTSGQPARCGSQSRGPGARVCDPQRVAREHACLSLRQGARPASLPRLTEPRSAALGCAPAAPERGQGTWQCCPTPRSSQDAAHRATLRNTWRHAV